MNELIKYRGKRINTWSNDMKNQFVITGLQMGENKFEDLIGRVAQVRLESGEYGTDNVLLRHSNDVLRQHSNQSFWLIPTEFKDELDTLFKDVYLDDSDTIEYSINVGQEPEIGFIVPSKINDGETTPLREIKSDILNLLKL